MSPPPSLPPYIDNGATLQTATIYCRDDGERRGDDNTGGRARPGCITQEFLLLPVKSGQRQETPGETPGGFLPGRAFSLIYFTFTRRQNLAKSWRGKYFYIYLFSPESFPCLGWRGSTMTFKQVKTGLSSVGTALG